MRSGEGGGDERENGRASCAGEGDGRGGCEESRERAVEERDGRVRRAGR